MKNDILLDENLDLKIENGDFATGESTEQHQQLLLLTKKGDWREWPVVGVGLVSWLKDDQDNGDLRGEIKREFEKDGMQVKSIKFDQDGNIDINALYP